MTLVNNPLVWKAEKDISIDAYINPCNIALSKMLQQMRRGYTRVVYSIAHGQSEIVDGWILEASPLIRNNAFRTQSI
ncbi:MAG: Potassium transporter peripheral membrane component [Candidatus Tokpelaia sp. JSC188]|nr:MAG: Potassium transporter peripheral membrane component [Candidatus Tokpelaia sp. JSC188]